jgi:hypothetical protein
MPEACVTEVLLRENLSVIVEFNDHHRLVLTPRFTKQGLQGLSRLELTCNGVCVAAYTYNGHRRFSSQDVLCGPPEEHTQQHVAYYWTIARKYDCVPLKYPYFGLVISSGTPVYNVLRRGKATIVASEPEHPPVP